MSESSSAMSLSKSGFSAAFSSVSALGAALAASPEGCPPSETGCFSMKEGSPLVTKSRALRAGFEGFTPAESQTALSLSAQSVMNSASA